MESAIRAKRQERANARANARAAWSLGVKPKFEGGHAVELLRGGDSLFPAMGAAIAQARRTVWLATYIFHDDAVAHTLALVLAAAARRGVQVRVVVDGFGSKSTLSALRGWSARTRTARGRHRSRGPSTGAPVDQSTSSSSAT